MVARPFRRPSRPALRRRHDDAYAACVIAALRHAGGTMPVSVVVAGRGRAAHTEPLHDDHSGPVDILSEAELPPVPGRPSPSRRAS